MRGLLSISFLLLVASAANAQRPQYPGEWTCSDLTTAYPTWVDRNAPAPVDWWLLGYLDGAAIINDYRAPEAVDRAAFIAELRAFCRDHPTRQLYGAARDVIIRNRSGR